MRQAQKLQVELVFADHDQNCVACARHGDCELQDLGLAVGLSSNRFAPRGQPERPLDDTMRGMVRDMTKCIRCLRCARECPREALRVKLRLPLRLYLRKKRMTETVVYV